MKRTVTGFAIMTLAAFAGCSQGTPGGPGTTDVTAKKPVYGQAEDTFNLSVPFTSTSLQQGEQMDAEVGIERAKNFDEDVTLVFADVPRGVTVEPAEAMIKHGDANVKVTFTAGVDAIPGDYKVRITGHPTTGGDAEIEFKLTVAAKDTFTLDVPRQSTSLRQGETKTVAIGISRDEKFDDDVTVTFGDMPTGVTLEPASPVMKKGEAELMMTLTAAEDAALGDFTIQVTGHPATGAEVLSVFKLTVVEK